MKSFLAAGRLGDAITVWARCTEEILADLNESNVLTFLSMIPDEITSDLLAPWLQTEVFPYLIVTFPTAVESLASWVDQRARNMELSEVKGWPANSLMFAGILPKVLDSIENGPLCQTPAQIATVTHHLSAVLGSGYRPTSALRRLNLLIEQLKSLGRMHNTYNCRLSLAAFTAETCETLCYRILDRVQAIELIASGIEQFAKPYMKENNLPVDQTLYQYVKVKILINRFKLKCS